MRWAILLLILLPAAQACILDPDFRSFAVDGLDVITDHDGELVRIRLGDGIQTHYELASGFVGIGEGNFVHLPYCAYHSDLVLYELSGEEIGQFAADSPPVVWNDGFSGLLSWNWQGQSIDGPELVGDWIWNAVSKEGHHVYYQNGVLHFSNGAEIPSDEPQIIALTPDGETAVMSHANRVWARGAFNWNWTVPMDASILDVTDTHVGTNWYRFDLQTGAVLYPAAYQDIRAVAADEELYWLLEDGSVVSEHARWETGTWTETQHPGWHYVGHGDPVPIASESETKDSPVGWAFAIPFVALYMWRRRW